MTYSELYEDDHPLSWMNAAICRGVQPDIWFPESYYSNEAQLAQQICAECPVCQECLTFAKEHRLTDGIWGGTTPNQRKNARRRRNRNQQPA